MNKIKIIFVTRFFFALVNADQKQISINTIENTFYEYIANISANQNQL